MRSVSKDIKLPDIIHIKSMGEGDSYKYLGVLQADKILCEAMKEKVKKRVFLKSQKGA